MLVFLFASSQPWFSWNEMEITEIQVVGTRSGNSFIVCFCLLPNSIFSTYTQHFSNYANPLLMISFNEHINFTLFSINKPSMITLDVTKLFCTIFSSFKNIKIKVEILTWILCHATVIISSYQLDFTIEWIYILKKFPFLSDGLFVFS